jgi:hypothetical protein
MNDLKELTQKLDQICKQLIKINKTLESIDGSIQEAGLISDH